MNSKQGLQKQLMVLGIIYCLFIFVFQAFPGTAEAASKKVNLRIASWNPIKLPPPLDYEPYTYAHDQWCDMIEEASEGRIKFTRFWGATLLTLPQLLDGVKSRMADIAGVHTPVYPGAFPMTEALQLPGLFPNARVGSMVTQKLVEEGYMDKELSGVKVLFAMTNAPGDIGVKGRQIKKLENWKGLRVGVMGEPETSMIKMLGAVPVAVPVPDQYLALDRNILDAVMLEFMGQVVFKFEQVADYYTIGNLSVRHHYMMFNQDAWNQLSGDLKTIFENFSGMKEAERVGAMFDDRNKAAAEYIESVGKKRGNPPIFRASDEEYARWREALEPLYERVINDLEAKGLPGKKMIDRCHELVETYSN